MSNELTTEELTGAQKAAIFLMAVGEEYTRKIFKYLADEEIRKIGECMAEISYVPQSVLAHVLKEFNKDYHNYDQLILDGESFLKNTVKGAISKERAENIYKGIKERKREVPFTTLKKVDAEILTDLIKGEHPQTIALILSHLDSDKAADILEALPKEIQPDVAMRIAEISSVPPEIVYEIDSILQKEIVKTGSSMLGNIDGLETVAEILNKVDRGTEDNILSKIDEEKQEMANEIRQLMFVFEDIVKIDDRGIREILKSVESQQLLLALKTASEEMKDKIFANLSERAEEMLREDMEVMGPVRLAEVEAAQQHIVKIARQLELEGKIVIAKGKEDIFV
jgi:flagellar motor switch protein FliG